MLVMQVPSPLATFGLVTVFGPIALAAALYAFDPMTDFADPRHLAYPFGPAFAAMWSVPFFALTGGVAALLRRTMRR